MKSSKTSDPVAAALISCASECISADWLNDWLSEWMSEWVSSESVPVPGSQAGRAIVWPQVDPLKHCELDFFFSFFYYVFGTHPAQKRVERGSRQWRAWQIAAGTCSAVHCFFFLFCTRKLAQLFDYNDVTPPMDDVIISGPGHVITN